MRRWTFEEGVLVLAFLLLAAVRLLNVAAGVQQWQHPQAEQQFPPSIILGPTTCGGRDTTKAPTSKATSAHARLHRWRR
jgi:hypothetical protein